ncbi:AAA family ATPase [Streptomyces sp. ISL-10]|uniref:HelD family protein n=1 Tax=Streptomyces sp. ISL-10 TaxID=2819172 RepID=UPI001BEB3D9E|nr:AAA family ATPase [Streptomyces sp. ISL-10]MBT2364862.1 AAA family ATPase [Streptomyces sp. ISL-10]
MTPLDPARDQEAARTPDHARTSALAHALDRERAFHDRCRAAMAAMADDAGHRVAIGADVSASGADAEALGYELRSHAKELREEPAGPLFFGRIDLEDGRHHHIGRRRISEHPAAAPLVIDWRAPVARTFYQASAREPQGVAVRRRFGWAPYSTGDAVDLTGLEDEHLGDGGGPAGAEVPGAGSAIVAGEIERPRVGPMRDIAATIQPEQDDLVRAPLADTVCVQGAPGTGKTAVGLHRAAYLLYTHPRRISRGGLLILGPNRTFLSYISEVLPALGEIGIRQATVQDEIARHEVRAEDTPAAAAVKHDIRMAAVLHRALYGRVGPPAEPLAVPDGSYRWRVPLDELERIVAEVREEAAPYAIGRERVRSRAVRAVQLQAERRAGPMTDTWVQRLGRSRAVTAFLDGVWPKVRPEEVLAALYTGPCDPLLTQAEQEAIRWARPPRSYRSAAWSAADLVLLDELAGLLERPDGYGHIVIDEAQDLSPMQCRAIARRARFGSLTVLGDLAQGTTPWAARDWAGQLAHLGKEGASVVALTTGYRVPAAIVDLANRLAGALGVDVPVARSLRHDGELTVRAVDDITAATVEAVRAALECEGSVGVIAAEGFPTRSLRAALLPLLDGEARERVAVLPATLAKGLEYDHVVVAEPAAIAAAEERGLHRLYVVLTRAVSRLDILHTRPLPPQMADGA